MVSKIVQLAAFNQAYFYAALLILSAQVIKYHQKNNDIKVLVSEKISDTTTIYLVYKWVTPDLYFMDFVLYNLQNCSSKVSMLIGMMFQQ